MWSLFWERKDWPGVCERQARSLIRSQKKAMERYAFPPTKSSKYMVYLSYYVCWKTDGVLKYCLDYRYMGKLPDQTPWHDGNYFAQDYVYFLCINLQKILILRQPSGGEPQPLQGEGGERRKTKLGVWYLWRRRWTENLYLTTAWKKKVSIKTNFKFTDYLNIKATTHAAIKSHNKFHMQNINPVLMSKKLN